MASLSGADLRRMASEVWQPLQLADIRLMHAESGSTFNSVADDADALTVRSAVSFKGDQRSAREVWARFKYSLAADSDQAIEAAENVEDVTHTWVVNIEMVACYESEDDLPEFEETQLHCFAWAIGLMHVHPYARETVQSLTSRMGYPPFTMEALDNPLAQPDEAIFELEDAD